MEITKIYFPMITVGRVKSEDDTCYFTALPEERHVISDPSAFEPLLMDEIAVDDLEMDERKWQEVLAEARRRVRIETVYL